MKMITANMLYILSLIMTATMSNMANPMKMVMSIVILTSLSTMINLNLKGTTWMLTITFLLFVGGVLLMFTLISSTMPNAAMKSNKMKETAIMILLALIAVKTPMEMVSDSLSTETKGVILSKDLMSTIMGITSMYFFSFLKVLQKNNNPLRSVLMTC